MKRGETFRDEVDRCAHILEPHLGVDIREVIYPKSESWKKNGRQPKGIDIKKMLGRHADVRGSRHHDPQYDAVCAAGIVHHRIRAGAALAIVGRHARTP